MDLLFFILATSVFICTFSPLLINNDGVKCPVCVSKSSWEEYYWGSNTNTKSNYCCRCKKVLHHYENDNFTIFDERQNFIS